MFLLFCLFATASLWYEGVPGFRRKTAGQKLLIISKVALLFPFYCMLYMIAPTCTTAKLIRKPFVKFLIHASSYLFFLSNQITFIIFSTTFFHIFYIPNSFSFCYLLVCFFTFKSDIDFG